MNFTNLRLKIRHFFRKYKRLMLVVFIVWAIIFFINMIFTNMPKDYTPTTTYEAHTSLVNNSETTPKKLQKPIEDIINEYVGYCNEGNYQKAFNMLSADCKKYAFNDDITKFMSHVLEKMPTEKVHSIQSYSSVTYNNRQMYIYQIKYTDDLLASGLTDTDYYYTTENITFYENDSELEMNVGDFMYHTDIKAISENEYLKIDVVDKTVNYSMEQYNVILTNRSNYTIVVADDQEPPEVSLVLPQETRNRAEINNIVLAPSEKLTLTFTFPKFVDDGEQSQSISFPSIRVMEKYSGVTENIPKEVIQSEIDNAISKFSMNVGIRE